MAVRSVNLIGLSLVSKRYSPLSLHHGMKEIFVRHSSYKTSQPVKDITNCTQVEISRSPEEWKFVERLLPCKTVPVPLPKAEYPSGWKPPSESARTNQYFVRRSKNHMPSVYLYRGFRGHVRITQITHIQGNIWALERDLKKYLLKNNNNISTQVHEVCGQINIRGDYVTQVQQWLLDKGF